MDMLIAAAGKYLIYVIIAVAFVYWANLPSKDKISMGLLGLIMGAAGFCLTKLASSLYFDPRPFVSTHAQPLIQHAADNGFPSDHTVLATLVALTVFHKSHRLGAVLLGLALCVGAARVAAGVHSPIDILGGLLVGALSYGIALALMPWVSRLMARAKVAKN